jgi:hypothetical protein
VEEEKKIKGQSAIPFAQTYFNGTKADWKAVDYHFLHNKVFIA